MPKILISDPVDSVCAGILVKNGFQVDQIKMSKDEILANIKNYDGLIVRSETKVTADVLKAGPKLKIIGRAGTGVDNVDCVVATQLGVLVMNTPGGNTLSAAEHTCALISSLARHIPQGCASLKTLAWERKNFSGHELYGKTLAILGLGRIGKEVAIRMQSYGMKTIGYDPIIPADVTREFGVESMTLEEIWPLADYVTVHTPLIPQTKHLINDSVFAKCKKGVKFINVARGGIIDEESLLRNLKNGNCGGAGLDVFVEEPPKSDYYRELLQHPLMVCTPHLGASTSEAQLRVAEEIGDQFVKFFNGTDLIGAVNGGQLVNGMANLPWLNLCKNLGLVASVFGRDGNEFSVTVFDPELKDVSFIETAVGAGYLSGITNDPTINIINGAKLIGEKGIKLSVKRGSDNIQGLLEISFKSGKDSIKIRGTIGSKTTPGNLTQINEHCIDLKLEGIVAFFNESSFSSLDDKMKKSGCILDSMHLSNDSKLMAAKIRVLPQGGQFGSGFVGLCRF